MSRRLLRELLSINNKEIDEIDLRNDKDYLANKRIECAGDLLSLLFEDLLKRVNSEVKQEIDKKLLRVKKMDNFRENIEMTIKMLFSSNSLTNGLVHAISSGNWQIKRFRLERKGVTQLLKRINYLGSIEIMNRIESHIEKTRKVSGPRSL